jgi:predicted nucleic acid-binding protein
MDKELICLDTSILIDYYRKKNKSKTKFVELSTIYNFSISVVTKLEILVGVNPEQRFFWQEVFRKMEIFPLKEKDVEIAAEIIQTLTRKNKIIGLKDILIASTAIANNLKLSTLNLKDFKRIDNLKILAE